MEEVITRMMTILEARSKIAPLRIKLTFPDLKHPLTKRHQAKELTSVALGTMDDYFNNYFNNKNTE